MQVSASAAIDVGGGDRFDFTQNRAIGRAYLEQLRRRYQNWPDAIAAYNWGISKMDGWIKAGRPVDKILPGVVSYVRRVIGDSGLCRSAIAKRRQVAAVAVRVAAAEVASYDPLASACTEGFAGRIRKASNRPNPSTALPMSSFEKAAASARLSWVTAMRDMFGCISTPGGSLRCR